MYILDPRAAVGQAPWKLGPGTAACLGAFDGFHIGHRALLERARALAERVAVVTFDPHPQRVLAPERAPKLLLAPAQREHVARSLGVDALVLLPFDRTTAQLEPAQFVDRHLRPLEPVAVVVGSDFRFGAARRGDAAMLGELLSLAGISLGVVPPIPVPLELARFGGTAGPSGGTAGPSDGKIGSTLIRERLAEGDVASAADLLGRAHAVLGDVVRGDGRGRTLGIPTANVAAEAACMPGAGVYAAFLSCWSPDLGLFEPMPAVANIGQSPTFTSGNVERRLEVHILDRDLGERLYGAKVEVAFVARLRDEMRFSSAAALVEQIHADIARTKTLLDAHARALVMEPPRPR